MRRLVVTAACCVLAVGGAASASTSGAKADDVRALAERLQGLHPNLFHDLARERFAAFVRDTEARADSLDDDELLVELMKLAALPGVRDGHTGIFPFDPGHTRVLHAYALRPYEFSDGTFVIGGSTELVGGRLVAVAGKPLAQVLAAVRPLVPHDNDSTLAARETQYAVSAEVLHGLGLIPAVAPVSFTIERDGVRRDVTLPPITTSEYTARIGDLSRPLAPPPGKAPAYLARQNTALWTAKLASGRVWLVGYNLTRVPTYVVAKKLRTVAKPRRVKAVIVDLRNNPGGDNHTYAPLLAALQRISRSKRIVVLLSRTTFSAAENFATDLERRAHPVFVGEPSGGSPNLYGDAASVELPASGLVAHVATIYWQKAPAGDPRLAIEPQVPVPLSSVDYFAGRDPVLDAAVRSALAR